MSQAKEKIEQFSLMTAEGMKILKPGDHWMTVTYGMSGWFAVDMWINPGEKSCFPPHEVTGPFAEPWTTGIGRYREKILAYEEAKFMAENSEMPLEKVEIKDATN